MGTRYIVVARLCFTPHLAVHRGIHTRRACVRTSQCNFFIVSHRFFSSVVPLLLAFVVVSQVRQASAVTSRSNLIFRRVKRRFKKKNHPAFFCSVLARSADNSVTSLAPLFSCQAHPQPHAADHATHERIRSEVDNTRKKSPRLKLNLQYE